jgi:hypothetical protein
MAVPGFCALRQKLPDLVLRAENVPVRLVCMIGSNASTGSSASNLKLPGNKAFLIAPSRCPQVSTANSTCRF